jgi:hypothetical protein
VAEDTHDVEFETYEESWTGRIVIAAVVALALIAGAFFAGKAMAGDSGGPATLAEAVQQAQKGDLPCGETATAAATPTGTPGANGGVPPAGGGGFLLRGICTQDGQGTGQNGQAGGRFGGPGGFAGQTVTAVSADSLTLEGPNGSTTVKLDASTTVSKSSGASVSDIKKGDSVIVAGAGGPNATQDAAARSVTILPQSAGGGS